MVTPGQLFVVDWPFTDASAAVSRPAVALGAEDSLGDVELLMITTRGHHADALPIAASDYAEGRLPQDSWVRQRRAVKVRLERLVPLAARLTPAFMARLRKSIILGDARQYSSLVHQANRPGEENQLLFEPGQTVVPYAGRVFGGDEVAAAVGSSLDFWLTLGPEGETFERELAEYLGVRHSLLVNSGSSANLLAFAALTSPKLPAAKRIQPGDEVITVAAGFPTTVAPIIQNGAVPVFIDNDPVTGNARVDQLEETYVAGKTKAVMMAHTLGNPFDLGAVLEFCRKYDLWLIEDNCDALGSTYSMPLAKAKALGLDHLLRVAEAGNHPLIRIEPTGSQLSALSVSASQLVLTAPTGVWGDLSTQSFYPPHHLTMGEGGAVNIVNRSQLKSIVESFRDWGRDCWCASGRDNTCGKRFDWQLGGLPRGYDHKYIYSHLGYNLKPLDLQAAIGRQQLKKLPAFTEARRRNWETLRAGLADLDEFFEFTLPTHATSWSPPPTQGIRSIHSSTSTFPLNFNWDLSGRRANPSWFGFMLSVRPSAPFTKNALARHLDDQKIGNRMLFGGNLLRQPVFVQLRRDRPQAFRVSGKLPGADALMERALFAGTYPGISRPIADYILESIRSFCSKSPVRLAGQ